MEQNKYASKSKHLPVGFSLRERKSRKQKSQGFVVRFHHDLKVLWRGYLSSLGGVGLPKFPIVYRRKIQMENGNARQCFVMLQACSEKRGAMKNLFIDIFSIDDQLRQKAAHSMERTYKAATELSVRYTCRRKHPLLFSHALWSRPETFQTNFATTICSWPIAFSETHLTAKKSTFLCRKKRNAIRYPHHQTIQYSFVDHDHPFQSKWGAYESWIKKPLLCLDVALFREIHW